MRHRFEETAHHGWIRSSRPSVELNNAWFRPSAHELWQRCGDSPKRVGGSIPHHRWVWPSLAGARGRTVQLCQWARRRLQKADRGSRAAARQRPVQCTQVETVRVAGLRHVVRQRLTTAGMRGAVSPKRNPLRGAFISQVHPSRRRAESRTTMAVPRKRRAAPAENVRPCSGGSTTAPSHWCVQSARSDTTYAQRGQSPGGARQSTG